MKIINDTHKLENIALAVFSFSFIIILAGAIINDVMNYKLKQEKLKLIQKTIELRMDADHIQGILNSQD
jgi:Na+/melibiose symporter-like transporter